MTDATRPACDQLAAPASRILQLVAEWEAITDPTERRLLLEELGYERTDHTAARMSAVSRMSGAQLASAVRGDRATRYRATRSVRGPLSVASPLRYR